MWEFITCLFQGAWSFFGLEYPGTGMTFAVIFFGLFLIGFAIDFLFKILGFSSSAAASGKSAANHISFGRGGK